MGTRNLTMVIHGGEVKVAQYGQWDGYPSGQGATALSFLRDADMDRFIDRLGKVRWVTEDEVKQGYIDAGADPDAQWVTMDIAERFNKLFPFLSRDHGAGILSQILNSTGDEIPLRDSRDFAADSLFCEYAYVIDLDKRTFEVYEGFNKEPVPEGERFASLPLREKKCHDSTQYYPIKHRITFSLDSLPTEEEFLAATEPQEEDEAA